MDDTLEMQGPPAPAEQAPRTLTTPVTPVTTAPAPQPSDAPTAADPMRVPEFVQALAGSQEQTQVPSAPRAPDWREQLPVASIAILLGALLVGWSLWQRRRLAAPARVSTTAAAKPLTLAQSQQLQRDVAELSEKLAHQLDVRAARLEKLLERTDQRISTLEKLLAQPAPVPAVIEPKPRPAPLAGLDTPHAQHREVYALADEGLTPVQIAQRLSRPTGQIELILNLRKAIV